MRLPGLIKSNRTSFVRLVLDLQQMPNHAAEQAHYTLSHPITISSCATIKHVEARIAAQDLSQNVENDGAVPPRRDSRCIARTTGRGNAEPHDYSVQATHRCCLVSRLP